ncbi:MAG TPA: glycosyltransferase family 25 protein, partial [Candidatus Binataceae bacterium]|nr:glycosyltransferase family 25 protein [Candidatus Binataceae bacterium]
MGKAAILASEKLDMIDLPSMYLINLDRSVERLHLFRERNGHLPNVIRVAAADGRELDRDALLRSGYITGDLPYGPGALGCAMSHLRLWEMAASQDKSITIFEDDVIVSYQFEKKALEVLSNMPDDWAIIQWGYLFHPLFLWVNLGISKAKLLGYGARRYAGPEGLRRLHTEEVSAPVR